MCAHTWYTQHTHTHTRAHACTHAGRQAHTNARTHAHAHGHHQYTCIKLHLDSLESLPQGLGSGIPIPLLTQDSAPLSSSLEQESQELVGYGYINLEHESSDQGVLCGISISFSSKFKHLYMTGLRNISKETISG